MGYKKYLKESRQSEEGQKLRKKRLIKWRREPVSKRVDNPTKPERAKALGYKPVQGCFVVRHRISRGGRQREQFKAGRRSKHMRRKKVLDMNYQEVAERRVAQKYCNCEVLGSYKVLKDGTKFWFEVVLADPQQAQVSSKPSLAQPSSRKGKVFRGLTSAGKKSR